MKIFALGSTLVGSSAINLIVCRPSNLVITDFPVHCGSLRNTKIHKQIHIQMHAQASEHTIHTNWLSSSNTHTHIQHAWALSKWTLIYTCDRNYKPKIVQLHKSFACTYIWMDSGYTSTNSIQTVSPRCCNQLHSAHASPFLIRSLVSAGLVTSCPPCQWHRHQPCHHQCHCHRFATIIVFFIIATLCF